MFLKHLATGLICSVLTLTVSAKGTDCSSSPGWDCPIEVSTVIHSDTEKVWATIMDFANYDKWNEWYHIKGEAKLHSTIEASLPKGKDSLFLKINILEERKKICWVDVSSFTYWTLGGMGGWRCRSLETVPEGVRFVNHFQATGLFKGAFSFFTSREAIEKGMSLENESLRKFLENRS